MALALASQSVLGDLFASLAIVLDRPFAVGDSVTGGEMSGTIERVGLKTTHLRGAGGEQLVLGNRQVLDSPIRNFGRMSERRVVFSVGVSYETAPGQAAAIPGMIREAVERQPGVRFDRAHLRTLGESALEFEAVYHTLTPEFGLYLDAQQAINLELLDRFREAGIEFAAAATAVHVSGPLPPPATAP